MAVRTRGTLRFAKAGAVVVRTELWNTRRGIVSKAVVRHLDGTFVGVTNQTVGWMARLMG